uniref:Nucleoprotein n=1 Tax=Cardioderma bat coronavirus/Kenya/KY43/2006 TaxID=983922 RepID=F1DAY0_9ALPC|nr:nucleocapsid protein [Cardioderma bat coronavirus/Kenya/KY43/2006]
MASVSFQEERSGRGRVPLSLFAPVTVTSDKNFWSIMPKNGVPTNGKANKDQLIGYWTEQKRWRMNRGQRKELPSKWHFYYLGTGPHADAQFRKRIEGVYWVANQGAKTENTGLGTRRRNQDLIVPQIPNLPADIQIVEVTSRGGSRAQSASRERSQSNNRDRSQSSNRDRSQNRGQQQRNYSRSRNNSQTRSGNNAQNQAVDIVAAVKQALQELGVTPKQERKSQKGASGTSTPKVKRSKSPGPQSPGTQRKQMERPVWKRVPTSNEDVTTCFGPRDTAHNFGDAELVRKGTEAPHYPQLAELVPTPAALLFGGEVVTREVGEEVEVTYVYKMRVPKDNKNLPAFLKQISAYSQPSQAASTPSQLNPTAAAFNPQGEEEQVEIIDQVYGSFDA